MKRIVFRRLLSARVKEYICVSKDMEIWLNEKIKVKRPLSQIYNGIDTRTFAPDGSKDRNRSKFGLTEGDVVIGVVGRLDPIKNHAMLFKSFEQINNENPDVKLLVVGGNSEIMDDGKTGQLVPSGDPAALGAALFEYIKSPELRASHGSQGRIRVKKLFSVEKMVNEYESVYRRVANQN